jgi:uncharacterized protein (DUF433 family)
MATKTSKRLPIHSDPEIMGGEPVFVGTRVPVKTLWDHLEAGDTLDLFLESFPSVTRKKALAVLELAKDELITRACADRRMRPRATATRS